MKADLGVQKVTVHKAFSLQVVFASHDNPETSAEKVELSSSRDEDEVGFGGKVGGQRGPAGLLRDPQRNAWGQGHCRFPAKCFLLGVLELVQAQGLWCRADWFPIPAPPQAGCAPLLCVQMQ